MASSVRRGVSPATPLRTGSISRDAVLDGLRNRFLADARNDREDLLYQILRFAQNDNAGKCSERQYVSSRKTMLRLLFLQLTFVFPWPHNREECIRLCHNLAYSYAIFAIKRFTVWWKSTHCRSLILNAQ